MLATYCGKINKNICTRIAPTLVKLKIIFKIMKNYDLKNSIFTIDAL
jgi:hypothetical protein